MKPFHSQWLLFFVVFFCSIVFAQDTIHVPADFQTIQEAINAVSNGDVILVAEGTYYENLQITSKSITLGSHFLIDGDTSHISRTIINGSQPLNPDQASVIWVRWSAEPTVICGFRITGGLGTKPPNTGETRVGGGINAIRSNITITDNQIINNSLIADDATGSGISIGPREYDSLSIIIRNNLIADNYAESEMTGGGGIAVIHEYQNNFNYLIENNTIRHNIIQNTAEYKAMGGGILLAFYLPTNGNHIIRNNLIIGNEAHCQGSSFGGGIYIIISESISDGSIDNDPGPYIYNNIIAGNHSDYLGGAVAVWRVYWPLGGGRAWPLTSAGHYTPKPSFVNNTIVDNTAEDGAGFYIMNHNPFLMNNILWNDYPSNAEYGEIFLGDDSTWTAWVEPNTYGDAEIHYTDIQAGWDSGEGNINLDPLFADTLFRLSDSSPCIGAGIDSIEIGGIWYYAPPTDIGGDPRPNPSGSKPDMGARESPLPDPIPVELISFSGLVEGDDVILTWNTATEVNNQGFEIERSEDNISFNKIGFVPGFGTTTEPKSYSYSDQSVNIGVYYYRLKQVDFDGSYEYSDVVEVDFRAFNSYLLEQNYPNPFNPSTTIGFVLQNKSNVKITVLNAIGEEVSVVLNEEREAGYHLVEFNAADLPSGVYFYQLKAGEFIDTKKMLLLK